MTTSISAQFVSQSYVQYERLHTEINSLVDKIVDALETHDESWIQSLFQETEEYSKSLIGLCFFLPFISKNLSKITAEISKEVSLTPEQTELLDTPIFNETLIDSIFNQSSLGSSWFYKLEGR